MVPFAKMLRDKRTEAGLTQRQLADAAGVSVSAVRDHEQGKRRVNPTLEFLAKVSHALGVSMDVWTACIELPASGKPAATSRRGKMTR